MGNKDERIRQKKAYYKGYYATNESQCKYKCGTACWSAWMDGWRNRLNQDAIKSPEASPTPSGTTTE